MNIIVKEGESIFDISLRYYGNISDSIQIMLDNPIISDINSDIYGMTLVINNPGKLNTILQPIIKKVKTTTSIIVEELESIFDVSLRYYGDISYTINLLLNNKNIENINSEIYGLNILVDPINTDYNVVYYNINNSKLRTGLSIFENEILESRSFDMSFDFSFD
jgi:hypothetical protein